MSVDPNQAVESKVKKEKNQRLVIDYMIIQLLKNILETLNCSNFKKNLKDLSELHRVTIVAINTLLETGTLEKFPFGTIQPNLLSSSYTRYSGIENIEHVYILCIQDFIKGLYL